MEPCRVAMAAGGSFVARAIDVDAPRLHDMLIQAAQHEGTSFIEIYQNCNVFNDGAFSSFAERALRTERTLSVKHGEPLCFGENNNKGLCLTSTSVEIVSIQSEADLAQVTCFDENDTAMANRLLSLDQEQYPVVVGCLHRHQRPCFESGVLERESKHAPQLGRLLEGESAWDI